MFGEEEIVRVELLNYGDVVEYAILIRNPKPNLGYCLYFFHHRYCCNFDDGEYGKTECLCCKSQKEAEAEIDKRVKDACKYFSEAEDIT